MPATHAAAASAESYDAIVLGAGAAGLFCAGIAGQRGLKVLLLDHADKVAEKIRISGGGRCNFTNRDTTPAQFLSANPDFCRSALARYTPADFIAPPPSMIRNVDLTPPPRQWILRDKTWKAMANSRYNFDLNLVPGHEYIGVRVVLPFGS